MSCTWFCGHSPFTIFQPFVYNATSSVLVSFDDPLSFAAKGACLKGQKLRGFAMWESGGDSDNLLLDAIRRGAGIA